MRGSLVTSSRFCIRSVFYMVEPVGLEPTMPEAEDLQSPGVTNFPTSPKNGVRYGIRTRILRFLAPCHDALTFRPNAHNKSKPVHMLAHLCLHCTQAVNSRHSVFPLISKLYTTDN